MKRLVALVVFALLFSPSVTHAGYHNSYDVMDYGAHPDATACGATYGAFAAAIADASAGGGGEVYVPPGHFCVDSEIKLLPEVSLVGASPSNVTGNSASTIQTAASFGPNKAVIRVLDRGVTNFGVSVKNLSVRISTMSAGVVGVDFSGVWYGIITGVGVIGEIASGPRRPYSEDSIGFLFSDRDGTNSNLTTACFGNLVERTSVTGVTTGYKFLSTQGSSSLNTITNFWVSDVMTGVWTQSNGGVGMSFRDGYMMTTLGTAGKKAWKHTGGTPSITANNVMVERGPLWFDAADDIVMGDGVSSPGPSETKMGGAITAPRFILGTKPASGYNCGATAACPCRPSTYPPPDSLSFWASIPTGTHLVAGANAFSYYTTVSATVPDPLPDLFMSFHVTKDGGVGQYHQFAGHNVTTTPYGYTMQTYLVSLYIPAAVTLSSDMIFFLQASTSAPE